MERYASYRRNRMSSIILDEKSIHILQILNYNQIRDSLINIIKWHDNGNNQYTLSSKDITDPQGTIGKELNLEINDTAGYIVTYLQGDNPVEPTVIIERYNINDGIRELSNLSNTTQSDRKYGILSYVEKTIKKDLQIIGEKSAVTS